ncbi:bestrophin family protein [Herbaspirillum sp. SJZ107]|uniref:bestrophin family protein n=1 Tax=Herbaspirillum sp. SJZ107 TaxID=2572881 RepID=UPI00114F3536|nr:bestrophin family protein [Herbaspirillum sp. SJZ107]TQK04769.1 putative membrane protein [Herbaspirillum sp. SJZ107]
MIVRDRPNGLRLFLVMRGSILPSIWKSLAFTTLLAIAVTLLDGRIDGVKITVSAIPFTLMGLPLAIFLGFRNNAAYDRFWEGRKQWGELVLRSRTLARQCLSLVGADADADDGGVLRERMLRRTVAYAHALRHHLRKTDPAADVAPWLAPDEWEGIRSLPNLPHALMLAMGADLALCLRERRLDPMLAAPIDATLSNMTGVAAACERIRGTPIPFSYTLLLHRTAHLYCMFLPFGLVDTIGYLTPLVAAIVAYTFFGLDALGDEIEEPFGHSDNDLPLDAICRTIEIDLRTALGERDLPPQLLPENYRLS